MFERRARLMRRLWATWSPRVDVDLLPPRPVTVAGGTNRLIDPNEAAAIVGAEQGSPPREDKERLVSCFTHSHYPARQPSAQQSPARAAGPARRSGHGGEPHRRHRSARRRDHNVNHPHLAALVAPGYAWLRCSNVGTTQSPGGDALATTISRDHVAWNGRRFDFSTALTVTLELDDGMWCYDCPSLGLLGCAPSPDDAIARFESEFAFLWDEIASESDDALLPQAQDLKRRLRRLVSSVREAA